MLKPVGQLVQFSSYSSNEESMEDTVRETVVSEETEAVKRQVKLANLDSFEAENRIDSYCELIEIDAKRFKPSADQVFQFA